MLIYGFDPGNTTGWAIFEDGEWRKDSITNNDFFTMVNALITISDIKKIDVVVIEGFFLLPDVWKYTRNMGPRIDTAKKVGVLEYAADLIEATCVINSPADKPTGYNLLGLNYVKGKKGMHATDAQAHIAHYLARLQKWKPEYRVK